MIFVTVGTDNHDFSRLVKKADEIAKKRKYKIVAQTGNTKYMPKNMEFFRFTSPEKLDYYYKKSETIITHGGAGSIINSLKHGKVPIVVPRLKKFNEHINDHQMELAIALQKRGKVVAVSNVQNLEKAISESKRINVSESKEKKQLLKAIANVLISYEK